MNHYFRKLAVFAAFCAAAVSAQATTYHFSYNFSNGDTIAGSFDGTANGDLISGLSNISLSFNGSAFPGTVSGYSYVTDTGDWVAGNAVASLDGAKNNFGFFSGDPINGPFSHAFMYIPWASYSADYVQLLYPGGDNYAPAELHANWQIAAVPEPETYAMFLAGLGAIGFAARRRKLS